MIIGRVDKVGNDRAFGWAAEDGNFSEHVLIEIWHDGAVVASGIADRLRADLKEGGFGEGDHAFEVDLPEGQLAEGIEVRATSSLSSAVLEFADANEHKFSELYDILVSRYDTLFAAMARRSQAFEGEFRQSLNKLVEERNDRVLDTLQSFDERLQTAEVSLMRIDEMVRRLIEQNSKKRRKLFLGIF
jgi:hypothetical protein